MVRAASACTRHYVHIGRTLDLAACNGAELGLAVWLPAGADLAFSTAPPPGSQHRCCSPAGPFLAGEVTSLPALFVE